MPIGINGIGSHRAQREIGNANEQLAATMKRIASGHRVNSASDDAASLAISEGLQAELRSLQQAQRNVNDGISMIQTADSALSSTGDMLGRMRELAVQASNDTLSDGQRSAIQTEFSQLQAEVDRVAATTEFNGKKLLDGSAGSTTLQVGPEAGDTVDVGAVDARGATLGVSGLSVGTSAGAQSSLASIDAAIAEVSESRAELGGTQNRLGTTIANLASRHENTAAANSRMRDADMAVESARLAAERIRQQVGVTMLGNLNRDQGAMLRLLGG